MKIKFNSDDDLPENDRTCNMVTVVRYVFHEVNKYDQKVFLRKCL